MKDRQANCLVIMWEGPHVREPMYYHGGVFDVAITGVTFAVSSGVARIVSNTFTFSCKNKIFIFHFIC